MACGRRTGVPGDTNTGKLASITLQSGRMERGLRYPESMRLLLLLLLLAVPAWIWGSTLPALGAPVGPLRLVVGDGVSLKLDELTENGPLLLVVMPAQSPEVICETARQAARAGAAENLQHIVAVAGNALMPVGCDGAKSVRLAHMMENPTLAQPIAMIVDDSLHVRLRRSMDGGESGWAALDASVARWFQGRQTYEANCGHCHGFDGAQASAPETKSLVGITRKYKEEKVLELGAQFGGVDMTGWSDSKKETLLSYLRGL